MLDQVTSLKKCTKYKTQKTFHSKYICKNLSVVSTYESDYTDIRPRISYPKIRIFPIFQPGCLGISIFSWHALYITDPYISGMRSDNFDGNITYILFQTSSMSYIKSHYKRQSAKLLYNVQLYEF